MNLQNRHIDRDEVQLDQDNQSHDSIFYILILAGLHFITGDKSIRKFRTNVLFLAAGHNTQHYNKLFFHSFYLFSL